MKTIIVISCLLLMLSTFAGSALSGTEGDSNTFYGIGAGSNTADDNDGDTYIGRYAGSFNSSGSNNNFIGYAAGFYNSTGSFNTFIGFTAGYRNDTGNNNNFIGFQAGSFNSSGSNNNFIGNDAGFYNGIGSDNNFLGYKTGYYNTAGSQNTLIGTAAGYSNITGHWNTFIGYQAGYSNTEGFSNVFLGYNSGYHETGSNKLYIDNTDTATPLIYGEFDHNILGVNGRLGIGTQTPARQLHLAGNNAVFRMDRTSDTAAFLMVRTDTSGNPMKTFVVGTNSSGSGVGTFVINDLGQNVSGAGENRMTINNDGSVTFPGNVYANAFVPSSMAYKDNIRTYENALETINKLRGVKFDWKDSGKPSVGLIAEEVEKVVPEIVAHNDGNTTGVNYASLVGVLVEAVKEQQNQHQEQLRINAALAAKIEELERLLASK